MTIIIIISAVLICLVGLLILINPQIVFGFLRRKSDRVELHIFAVLVRLLLGALLVYQSDASRYPFIIQLLGLVSIVSALFLAAIGRDYFRRFMTWALLMEKPFGRAGGVIAAAFGAFLLYAFIHP
ncbi:MAG: hypothetical protein ACI9KN_001440 [Gammaproteobacteria bacterium]|jgi:hypothetical protein